MEKYYIAIGLPSGPGVASYEEVEGEPLVLKELPALKLFYHHPLLRFNSSDWWTISEAATGYALTVIHPTKIEALGEIKAKLAEIGAENFMIRYNTTPKRLLPKAKRESGVIEIGDNLGCLIISIIVILAACLIIWYCRPIVFRQR